jgi:hypothetical protein
MARKGWGGPREGSGPKPKKRIYSDKVKAAYIKAANKLAKEHGVPLEEAILALVYDPKAQAAVKVAAMKLYNEALLIKSSESDMTVSKEQGPKVYLPQRRADPAKVVQLKVAENDGR